MVPTHLKHRNAPAVRARTLVAALALAGCAGRTPGPRAGSPEPADRREGPAGGLQQAAGVYREMGLITAVGPIPYVGRVAFLAGPSPDSTLVLLTLSFTNNALSFGREGDRYRAAYTVRLDITRTGTTVRHIEASEIVRVTSFRETSRADESVLFQQMIRLSPGDYRLVIALRDEGSTRNDTHDYPISVPALRAGALSTPLVVYDATPRPSLDSVPRLVVSPRATVMFGRDTVIPVYLEGYGAAVGSTIPVRYAVRDDKRHTLWTDSATLPSRGTLAAEVLRLPVSRVGVGATNLVVWRVDSRDTARTPMFVTFGEDLPVTTFDEMVNYLRYYTTSDRLQALRNAPAERRAAAWLAFLRETDSLSQAGRRQGLREYFSRIQQANIRFRDEGGPGWLTDRGALFIVLGEPDQIIEERSDLNRRGRAQAWQYREQNVEFVLVDQTGFGQWKLTPRSYGQFQSLLHRILAGTPDKK